MQQATSANGNLAPASGNFQPAASPQTSFVINLCASTTPVGLVHPSHPQLKRFTFFVSRRREEGRERFRLHMGYFSSQEEAEKLLDAVRDIYPAAWAGVAPGQNLRARYSANGAANAAPKATATTAPAAAAAPRAAAPPAAAPRAAAPPAAAPARSENTANHSLSAVRAAIDALRDRPAPEPEPLREMQVLSLLEDVVPPPAAAPAATALRTAAVNSVPSAARPVARSSAGAAPPPAPVSRAPAQLRTVSPAARPAAPTPTRAPTPLPAANAAAPRRELAAPPELAAYAVQLLWSVQPIDISQIPQLAIFAAYTLYGAEGNRDGRRWYGLRLGFFTDAVSAKQVAQYVRSEFKSVSVVPVTQRERSRANAATAKPLPSTAATKTIGHELNFIEDIPTDTAMSGSRPALQLEAGGIVRRAPGAPAATSAPDIEAIISELAKGERAGAARSANRGPSGKRAKLRVAQGGKPVSKRPQHEGPLTFEETLEILGASTLQLDHGRGELLNDASSHDRRVNAAKTQRGSRFGRLMDRLAERFGGT